MSSHRPQSWLLLFVFTILLAAADVKYPKPAPVKGQTALGASLESNMFQRHYKLFMNLNVFPSYDGVDVLAI